MQEGPFWVSTRRLLTYAEYIGFESQQDTEYFDSAFRAFTQYRTDPPRWGMFIAWKNISNKNVPRNYVRFETAHGLWTVVIVW
jgi:hypothetical protein